MSLEILILGPQGSGKGTQARRIAEEYGVAHIATGDMLRAAVAEGTALGRRVQPILESGALVPDELMVELIRERLARQDAEAGFVLDGFPRTLPQADVLDGMLEDVGRRLDLILELQVPADVLMERMRHRAETEGRADDTPGAIRRRLDLYRAETEPVVEHYRASGNVIGIHGDRTPNEVFAEIQDALEAVESR